MRVKVLVGMLCVAWLVGVGCAPPPKASDVAARAAGQVTEFARGALSAANSVNGLKALNLVLKTYAVATTGQPGQDLGQVAPASDAFDQQLSLLSKFVTERVFTEANVESTEGSATIFRLMGDDLCNNGTVQADPKCVDSVDRLELRLKATSPADGDFDLTLLVGPRKVAPLVFKIRKDTSLALEGDLAQGKAAAEHVASVVGQSLGLPQVMEGVLQVLVEKTGANAYALSGSVLSAVHVELDSNGDAFRFTTAMAQPLSRLAIDGDMKKVTLGVGLGETEFSMPYRSSCAACTTGQRAPLTLHLGGASYGLDVTVDQSEFTLSDLGLGEVASWASYDGTHILDVDLSPRRFAATLREDPADHLPVITLSSGVSLTAKAFFSALAATGDPVTGWLADETYTVAASGSAPSFKPVARPGQARGSLKVVSGGVSLATSKAGVRAVTASAGQCLVGNGSVPSGGHALLGQLSVVSCP